jgi:hypothetical protein
MTLTPNLTSLKALFRKLERESYRAYHASSRVHKADHFFNFCVTAHSLRDYLLEDLGKFTNDDKKPFHQDWDAKPLLVAVGEIANMSKHFRLRHGRDGTPKVVRTQGVVQTNSDFVMVYLDAGGRLSAVQRKAADIDLILSDGSQFSLHEFTDSVLTYWRTRLKQHGLRINRQTLARLSGS